MEEDVRDLREQYGRLFTNAATTQRAITLKSKRIAIWNEI